MPDKASLLELLVQLVSGQLHDIDIAIGMKTSACDVWSSQRHPSRCRTTAPFTLTELLRLCAYQFLGHSTPLRTMWVIMSVTGSEAAGSMYDHSRY